MECGRIFYVDNQDGNDENCGLTDLEAWRSIEKVNSVFFAPGDKLLFKRGGSWNGMLMPKGSGTKFQPICLETYGEGEKPVIHGNDSYAAILLEGVDYWHVKEFKVTNRAENPGIRQGICICARPVGITQGISISDCEVTEVIGEHRRARAVYESMYWNGGIYVTFPGRTSTENHLHDICISNNKIHQVTTSGIRINQDEDFINDIHHTHVVVRGNWISHTGADGIIVANCISPLIDGNKCFYAGALGNLEDTQLIAGIWVCAVSNALIQRNEVAFTRLFENDGTAFDTDWGTAGDTVFQYNYSHDNEGGFWLDCMKLNYNRECGSTIFRHNISLRDGRGIGVYDQGLPVEFYHNLFYYDKPLELCCFDECINYKFEQNTFLFQDELIGGWKQAIYSGNVYGKLEKKEGIVTIKAIPSALADLYPTSVETFDLSEWEELVDMAEGNQLFD